MPKKLILCDCTGTQSINRDAIGQATGLVCSRIHSALCMGEIESVAKEMTASDVIIACQQERPRFEELAAELGTNVPDFIDLRDRAGWSDDGERAGPKMAALLAEAQLTVPSPKVVDVISEGMCLIVGPSDIVLPAAEQLCDVLSVTVLVIDDPDLPWHRNFDVIRGALRGVQGALGGFEVRIDALQQIIPGGRGALQMTAPKDGAISQCDILLDLTGKPAMVPAPQKRNGYLRADPRDPKSVAKGILDASQLIGTFEKPFYVALQESLCAHSRAGQIGCSNCLNVCPTGAITPNGDHVAIDPMICAGCGACSALCPSGAITYDDPPVDFLFRRIDTLSRTYRQAGGEQPRLLVCDRDFGTQMISLAARFGRGLPADVIPLDIEALSGFGHAEMLAALASGFAGIDVLLSPKSERDVLEREQTLAVAIAGKDVIRLLDLADPDQLCDVLYDQDTPSALAEPVLTLGTRRQVARLAGKALQPNADTPIPLPENAPYGAVLVNTDACTLCLSCVSLCPSGALVDNPDMPQLRFQEDACLQCGLCKNICPENAIELKPQLDTSDTAFDQRVLNEEEPFACIECGSLFGVKSTIEKITEKLAGKHAMFATSDAAKMIQMCDNCRVQAQYHSENNPFTGKERPAVRTTDDYFSKRKDH
ncbi:4Fe-4S binding protein [Parasulfitobacter algicola]|uniref:4Fe-4S binding protein n=1 Tax=Parasulfitobacter algicola TaxID=2614809 RepID=A0ABX2IX27_9RHOB|nr:4Fe-4S binding protein [Sulfitobacter algicola]NSX55567.1 4Fe-4S binding protein [Sulfitobacter algicola]